MYVKSSAVDRKISVGIGIHHAAETAFSEVESASVVSGVLAAGVDAVIAGFYGNVAAVDRYDFGFKTFIASGDIDDSVIQREAVVCVYAVITGVQSYVTAVDDDRVVAVKSVVRGADADLSAFNQQQGFSDDTLIRGLDGDIRTVDVDEALVFILVVAGFQIRPSLPLIPVDEAVTLMVADTIVSSSLQTMPWALLPVTVRVPVPLIVRSSLAKMVPSTSLSS